MTNEFDVQKINIANLRELEIYLLEYLTMMFDTNAVVDIIKAISVKSI